MPRRSFVPLLALVLLAPSALADQHVPQGASHLISVHADAVAAGAAAVAGESVWYDYARPALPQIPCRGAVVHNLYLLDLGSGARHHPVVGGSSTVSFRSDGPTNGFLAKALGGEALVDVELRVEVLCTDPAGASASVLVATIGVTP